MRHSPIEAETDLSTCPPGLEDGQVDRSRSTFTMQGNAASALWQAELTECAAPPELRAHIPRAFVDGFARLDPDQPPADVPLRRWHRFVDDCGLFFDGGWAAKAEALGWAPLELFGCDRLAPFARIDRMGLLWLLNGCPLVAMTDAAAVIECSAGVHQTYRRVGGQPGRVLAWAILR